MERAAANPFLDAASRTGERVHLVDQRFPSRTLCGRRVAAKDLPAHAEQCAVCRRAAQRPQDV